uniref:Uncharacterized protein n=1 Tax=Tanacetum cinerariifolium TaxID=118510 RepID=A0A6L2J3L4_TANCI|nr:hypothetical protein [Tanacetum cinerariifolium]
MGGVMAQIIFEGAPIQSSDPPLSTSNTIGSGEDRVEHEIELTDPVLQTPYASPLSGGYTPRSDKGSMTLKELMNLYTTLSHKDADTKVIVEDKDSGEKGGSTAEIVSTARPDISAARPEVSTAELKTPPTTTTLFDDEDVIIVDTLVKMKSQKAKEKGVAFKDVDDSARPIRSITTLQPLLTIDPKDKGKGILQEPEHASKAALAGLYDEVQAQIDADHELATRLTMKNKRSTQLKKGPKLAEFFERRKKQLAKERAEAIKSKPPIKTQLRNLMMTYLKHTGSEEDEKRVGSRKKRAAGDDKAINYETLDVKSLIVNCESHVLGTMVAGDVHVYKLTRLDGSYKHFSTFSRMLEATERQDVLDLHKIVMERFPANDPKGYDLILWGD